MTPETPDPLTAFLDLMLRAELDVSLDGVMDAFWLALQPGFQLEFPNAVRVPAPVREQVRVEPASNVTVPEEDRKQQPAKPDPIQPPVPKPAPVKPPASGAAVFQSGAADTEKNTLPASPLRIPAGAALAGKLPMARSLRPLRKRFRNPQTLHLDEDETVEESARAGGMLIPVLRPALERWYELVVVADSAASMDVWQETMSEFEAVARTAGVFRNIRRYRLVLGPAGAGDATLVSVAGTSSRAVTLAQTNVRRLIFIATNGTGAAWTDGGMARLVGLWSRHCSVAVLQMLPEQIWPRVRLGEPSLLLRTMEPGTVTACLDAGALWWDEELVDDAGNARNRVAGAVPILPLDPAWLGKWAGMQMGGGQWVPGIVVGQHAAGTPRQLPAERTAEDWARVVNAFSRDSTPEAHSLAVYLSRGAFTLPVARLVQAVKLRDRASQTQLAELLLSGIVERTTPADAKVLPEWVEYRFHPEAAKILARDLRESDKEAIAQALAAHIERYLGQPVDFQALVYDEEGRAAIPEWAQPFARLGSLLLGVPLEEEPPDDGRPTIFIVWVAPSLRALARQIAEGLDAKRVRVLVSGRHRVPAKGVVLVLAEDEDQHRTPHGDFLRAIESGLDGMMLLGPGVKPWGKSYLFHDAYSSFEEMCEAILTQAAKCSQDAAPPVTGAPPLDREHGLTNDPTLSKLAELFGNPAVVVYSNEEFAARSAVRDLVWIRDQRLKFPAGIRWLRRGDKIAWQPGELLVLEKFEETVQVPEGSSCLLLDPQFPAAAHLSGATVYEGYPEAVARVREKLQEEFRQDLAARKSPTPAIPEYLQSSPHLLSVLARSISFLDHASSSPSWPAIAAQAEGAGFIRDGRDSLVDLEWGLRSAIFHALPSQLSEMAGTLAALRDDAPAEMVESISKPGDLMVLSGLDMVDLNGPVPRATAGCRALAAEMGTSWMSWNDRVLEMFGLRENTNWYDAATRSDYVRRHLVYHAVEAKDSAAFRDLLWDFRWWALRIEKDGAVTLLNEIEKEGTFYTSTYAKELLQAGPDVAQRSAVEIAGDLKNYTGQLPDLLRQTAEQFLGGATASAPAAPPEHFILMAGSRPYPAQETLWAADAIAREAARRGFGLVCGVQPGSDQTAITAFVAELRHAQIDPSSALRIVTFDTGLYGAVLPEGTSVQVVEDPVHASVNAAAAVVLLGGNQWVRRVYTASVGRKPVLPVPGTGDAALELFEQQVKTGAFHKDLPWARSLDTKWAAEGMAAALLDAIEERLKEPPAKPPYETKLLEQWRDFLAPSRDAAALFDWRPRTPVLPAGTIRTLIYSSDAAERLIGFTSFWRQPSKDLAAEVAAALLPVLESTVVLTEWEILLGICNVMLLEPELFPGDDIPSQLESVLERQRVHLTGGSKRGRPTVRERSVHDRLKKLDAQIEAWILAERIRSAKGDVSPEEERALGRIQPAYGRHELENHLKRGPGASYRIYAYAVLLQNPDASLLDLLVICLVGHEDSVYGLDLGLRAVQAMAKGHPLSDAQVVQLRTLSRHVPAGNKILASLAPFYPTVSISSPPTITFYDDSKAHHGLFVITRGQHELHLPPSFRIGTSPVTNDVFLQFVLAGGYANDELWGKMPRGAFLSKDGTTQGPSTWPSSRQFPAGKGNHPVAGVSYGEAKAFARWLQTTHPESGWVWGIPTEDMWEFSARSPQGLDYPFGTSFVPGFCNSAESSLGDTSDVTKFVNGKSPYGCLDMAGNVWEFVAEGDGDGNCVLRGGSFKNNQQEIRNCFRLVGVPLTHRAPDFGFRCAQIPELEEESLAE